MPSVLDREPAAGAAEARHHLVGDEHDAVPVADLPDAGEVARRRHHDPGGAGDGLEHDRGDGRRPLEGDDLLEVLERALALLGLGGGVERAAVEERAEEVDGPGRAVVARPAARVAGHVDREVGAAVVAAVGRQHLVAAGVQPRHAYGVLVGVGAAVGEEDVVEVAGGVARDQPGGLGAGAVGDGGRDRAEVRGLLLDRRDDARVLVAEVGEDQLGAEVEVALVVASQTWLPSARVTTIGVISAWADQEWKTCARSSS